MAHSIKKSPASEAEVSKKETQMANLLEKKQNLLSLQSIKHLITNLKVQQKINLGYAIGLGFLISGNLIGLIISDRIYNHANESKLKIQRERKLLIDLQQSTLSLQLVPGFPLSSKKVVNSQDLKNIIIDKIERAKSSFKKLNQTAENSSIKGLKPVLLSYGAIFKSFIENLEAISRKNDFTKFSIRAVEDLSKNQTSLDTQKLINQITIFIQIAEAQQLKAEAELQHTYVLKTIIILLNLVLSVLCIYFISLYLNHAIASPVEALLSNFKRMNHQLNLDLKIKPNNINELIVYTDILNEISQQISDLKKSEKQLKTDAKIANQTQNQFLANMTHELRTPLNGILGYAQILSRSRNLTEEQKHGIHTIYQCGFNLLNMINDILDISKIDNNKIELNSQDFHFPSLIQGLVEFFRLQAEKKGIEFVYKKSDNLPIGLIGDQQRLRQVLVNLLNNAIKFTDTGQITLQVDTSYNLDNVLIHFAVSDTGIGIISEQQEKIFLPFEKLGNSHSQTSGTGLGLAISQTIVRMMGSEIKVQSQLGMGSLFEFAVECPISEDWTESIKNTANGKLIGYSGNPRKILVIDDNWENRSFIVSLLEPLNFIVSEAINGEEGLKKCFDMKPDLIICDLEMPIMSGWEFMTKIRYIEEFKNTIIIISSANRYNYDRDYEKNILAGANDLLLKPIQVEKLYLLLEKNLKLVWKYGDYDFDPYLEQNTYSNESSEILSQVEIIIPPVSDLTTLMKYVKKGQIKGIKQELEKIATKDIKYEAFVKTLNKYVKVLNIQKIRQFLQENIQK
ncbi:ATP-binding protein [Calothrix sp. PCC 6303]|uniref:ATP-binding response regulator n=1 Tax=Calothrix sp. PCC 6303 TaxID=1170562 RepID=UPI0002A04AE6|nr:ATP-binding protein [Calothrix sp. PCC 6303]AFZ02285.1 integral membrane sensor hybrid histidine kinase [Calothrix sp. PCC 6303]